MYRHSELQFMITTTNIVIIVSKYSTTSS